MGATGVGRGTFISLLSDKEKATGNGGLQSFELFED
jgi:hypothetical protein